MAKNVINEKGFKIVALTPGECRTVGFGFQYVNYGKMCHELVCDNCNEELSKHDEVYYVSVLHRVFCKECLTDWYDNATYYSEDKDYEDKKYSNILHSIEHYNLSLSNINFKDICNG